MLPEAAPSTSITQSVVKMLCERGAQPRLAMRGTSMLPLLREPMVLQLRPFRGTPRLGEVLVFSESERFVAHRFLSTRSDGMIVLAGDACADTYDVIAPERVVGTVDAVWSGAHDSARRVDGPAFRLRGLLVAYRRASRIRIRRARHASLGALRRINPCRRPRAYVALFNAMAAILQADGHALQRHVASVDSESLLALAVRHRCGPLLIDGLETLGVAQVLEPGVLTALRKERWSTAARTRALRRQLDRVIEICGAAGIAPVLLKGAARLYARERDSDRHDSDDIDILLAREDIAVVTAALHKAGYAEHPGTVEKYEPLHHTAPLVPRAGVAVELHHVLAEPGTVSMRTDLASFAGRVRFIEGPSGNVGLLDDFASALHSAVHAREPTPLRNLIILAQQVRRLSAADRAALYALADREGLERHRIHAALHAASRLAGLASFASAAGRRQFGWRLRRFDLPLALASRSDAIEWFVATSGRGLRRVGRALLPLEDEKQRSVAQPLRGLRFAARLAVKPAITAFIAAYAMLMPAASADSVGPGDQAKFGEMG